MNVPILVMQLIIYYFIQASLHFYCHTHACVHAGGLRTESSPGEWPVSYHGTNKKNVESIAAKGYKLSKGMRFKFGRGIYSSPNIEVAEVEDYAAKFKHGKTTYKVVFQNRVCPNGLEIIPAKETQKGEYWVQPKEKLIRPYGLCIKQVKS